MDGHQYEYKCAEMLKRKGFSKVSVTKGSGDQGIDVLAYSGGKKYGIQCKYYSSPVGNFAVQEALAGAKFYDCNVAVVMSNTTFTKSAKELAQKTNVLLWENNKIPLSEGSFKPTKYVGILLFIIGVLGLILTKGKIGMKFPILQKIQFITLILGGFLSIFEYGAWAMPFIASIFYLAVSVLELIFAASSNNTRIFSCMIYILITALTFMRSDYLHLKTNRYHIWKNCFKQFLNDNFRGNK